MSAGISCFCLTAYLLSLLPAGDQRSSQYQEFRAEADSLLDPRGLRSQTSYGGFLEVADPHYLGVAKDRAPFLNRFSHKKMCESNIMAGYYFDGWTH